MSHKRSLTRDLKILRRGRLRERNFLNYQVMRARDQRILAGKRDSRRRFTTGFSENVKVTEKKLSNVRSLSFSIGIDRSFYENIRANFSDEQKRTMKFFLEYAKTLEAKSRTHIRS